MQRATIVQQWPTKLTDLVSAGQVAKPELASGRVELSPVLDAMGIKADVGMGAVRFSLGRATTTEEIDTVVAQLADILAAAG